MDIFERQVRRIARRLVLARSLRIAPWCLGAGLLLAAVLIEVGRWASFGVAPQACIAGGLGWGFLTALTIALVGRPTPLAAALEIDRRHDLGERVSSSWSLSAEARATPAGRALFDDTAARLETLALTRPFGIWPPVRKWAPTLIGLLIVALAWKFDILPEPTAAAKVEAQRIAVSNEALRTKLAKRSDEARGKGLEEARKLLEKLEQQTASPERAKSGDTKQTLVKLNDLVRQVEERRGNADVAKRLKEQLARGFEQFAAKPADRLAQALARGDFAEAKRELERMRKEQAEAGSQQAAAGQQLAALERQLDRLADVAKEHAQKADAARDRAQTAQPGGGEQRQPALDETPQAAADSLKQLAEQARATARALEKGDRAGAAERLAALEDQLAELARQSQEAELLDEALDDIAQAKAGVACRECRGEGCEACRVAKDAGAAPSRRGWGKETGNRELGRKSSNEAPGYASKVAGQIGRGEATVIGSLPGTGTRGQVTSEVANQWKQLHDAAADPQTNQRLPPGYRQRAQAYFDALRQGP